MYTVIDITFSGQWSNTYNLTEEREFHSSWDTKQGLVLMGGVYSLTTSEIVPTDGGQGGPAFDMKYQTM